MNDRYIFLSLLIMRKLRNRVGERPGSRKRDRNGEIKIKVSKNDSWKQPWSSGREVCLCTAVLQEVGHRLPQAVWKPSEPFPELWFASGCRLPVTCPAKAAPSGSFCQPMLGSKGAELLRTSSSGAEFSTAGHGFSLIFC